MLSIRSAGYARVLCAGMTVLVAACTFTSPSPPTANTLRIGVDLPLSGPERTAAAPALNGIRYYVQTHSTLDGFTVQLDTADDAGVPERGASNVNRFLTDQSVVAMIGPFDGPVARKQIPIANTAGLAIVSPATSNPCLTRDVYLPGLLNPSRTAISCKQAGLPSASDLRPTHTNNFFRLTATDDLQGAAAADFAYKNLHVLRAAVISDHEAYGQALADAFSAKLTRLGGAVLGRLDVEPNGSSDVNAFLSRMNGAGAQAVYYGGGSKAGCTIRAKMSPPFASGEAAPFLGGDAIASDPACVTAAGGNASGVYGTAPIVDAGSTTSAATAIAGFKKAFGSTSAYGPYTMLAYDATAVVYAALDRAIQAAGGRPSRAEVIAELAKTSGLAGVTGKIGFDPNGDTTNRVISVYESPGSDARAPWKQAGTVDYSSGLPY